MKGKTVVITGGTSGIGEIAAQKLAQMGSRIIFIARSQSRASATLSRLQALTPGVAYTVHYADLTQISEMKRVATEIAAQEPRIDILINNAGAIFASRKLTQDGLESTFALNHMAYFVVTAGLRERLIASAPARIVNTASIAHRGHILDLGDLQMAEGYNAMEAYGRSKLCNILFTRELARRLQGTAVTTNCLHPGFVATRIGDDSGGLIGRFAWLAKLFALSREEGAQTIVYLASSPEVAQMTGQYFYKCRPAVPSPAAQDDNTARVLWEHSTALANIKA